MSKKVSGKTHTKEQLDDWANQHNPNNKAYKANVSNTADGAFSFTLAEDNIAFSGVKVDNANALKAVTTAVESLYAANNPAEEPVEEDSAAEGEEDAEGEGEEAVEE